MSKKSAPRQNVEHADIRLASGIGLILQAYCRATRSSPRSNARTLAYLPDDWIMRILLILPESSDTVELNPELIRFDKGDMEALEKPIDHFTGRVIQALQGTADDAALVAKSAAACIAAVQKTPSL